MSGLEEHLPLMRAAWMAGRTAVDDAPAAWRAALSSEPDLALAALAGQASQTLFLPTPPDGLAHRALLPPLAAPMPIAPARVRIKRLLAAKPGEAAIIALVRLVDSRGLVMHPADWMPTARDDWAPDRYAPWLAWAASERIAAPADLLTADTYDDWSWAERRARLAAMRQTDPRAACAIIAAKIAKESPEHRLRLTELLPEGLDAADVPLLQTLAGDRSERVSALAGRLLARLGHGVTDEDLVSELAGMIGFTRVGILRRRNRLTLEDLKTAAQEARRRQLLGLVTLPDLARRLGVTEAALFEAVPTGIPAALACLVEMVAGNGSAEARRALLDRIIEDPDSPIERAIPLADSDVDMAPVLARESSPMFEASAAIAGKAPGRVLSPQIAQAPAYRALIELIATAPSAAPPEQAKAEPQIRTALWNLGLMLAASAARDVITQATASGISPADPRLELLYLNATLEPEART